MLTLVSLQAGMLPLGHGRVGYLASMLTVGFVSLFPEMLSQALGHSIMGRAERAGLVRFVTANPRDFAQDKHRSVDDASYGGGPGMVMMAPLVASALQSLAFKPKAAVILCDPTGTPFNQRAAHQLSQEEEVAFICGHYEGIDERVRTQLATHVYSIGDYVLTGGELPALVMTDAIVRLLPGALGSQESHMDDSYEDGLLGFPLYTRPEEFHGERVPEVLLSGDHGAIARWRRAQQVARTRSLRPDLLAKAKLKKGDL